MSSSTKIHGINIKIGAETSGVSKAFNEINKELNSTASELKKVDKLLELNPNNITLLAQKQELLSDAINQSKSKLEALNKAYEKGLNDETIDKHTKQWRELEQDIINTTNRLEGFQKQEANIGLDDLSNQFDESSASASLFSEVLSADLIATGIKGLINAIPQAIGTLNEFAQTFQNIEALETKFASNVKNTTDATDEQIDAYIKLAEAKEKEGVISKQSILQGAQELATYVESIDAIEQLTDAMLDMSAQQYGVDASESQVMGIATTLGKALSNGDYSGLTRLGYGFDELQQKIMETGTEADRTKVLIQVISSSVGGMNNALSKTSSGKQQQLNNELTKIKENIGEVWANGTSKLGDGLMPIIEDLVEATNKWADSCFNAKDSIDALNQEIYESLEKAQDTYQQLLLNYNVNLAEAELLDELLAKYNQSNISDRERASLKIQIKDAVDELNKSLGESYYYFNDENGRLTELGLSVDSVTASYNNLAEATRKNLWLQANEEAYTTAKANIEEATKEYQEVNEEFNELMSVFGTHQADVLQLLSEFGDNFSIAYGYDNLLFDITSILSDDEKEKFIESGNAIGDYISKLEELQGAYQGLQEIKLNNDFVNQYETVLNTDEELFDEMYTNIENGLGAVINIQQSQIPQLESAIEQLMGDIDLAKAKQKTYGMDMSDDIEEKVRQLSVLQEQYKKITGTEYTSTSTDVNSKLSTSVKETKKSLTEDVEGNNGILSILQSITDFLNNANWKKTIEIDVDTSALDGNYTATSNQYTSNSNGFNSGGVSINNTINVNGSNITENEVENWANILTAKINKNLGRML